MSSKHINPDAWPDTLTDPDIRQLLERYYQLSNGAQPTDDVDGDTNERAFADLFHPGEGVYQLASKRAQGRDAIFALRKALFAYIPRREHTAVRIFTHGGDQMRVAVLGTVSYGHHAGHETGGDWAAEIVLTRVGGELKFLVVKIIVDTAAHV